jgi:hypothetical protein
MLERHWKYKKYKGWPGEEITSPDILFEEKWWKTRETFRSHFPGLKPTAKENCANASHVLGRDEEVRVIEDNLVKIPEAWVYYVYAEYRKFQKWAHSDLVYRLEMLVEKVFNKYKYFYPIPLLSAYRRLGTTVYGGKTVSGKTQDTCGKEDSTDQCGHWQGLAMDLETKPWRALFDMKYIDSEGNRTDGETNLTELDYLADDLGEGMALFRPWKSRDECHWTTEKKNWYKKPSVEPYKPGWENSRSY